VDMALTHSRTLSAPDIRLLARLDLRFRSETIIRQLGSWPLGLNGNAMACFYNDTPLPFIGKGDSHLLQHLLTTKVDAEHIPNTRLGC
jgi:hypothetical protein